MATVLQSIPKEANITKIDYEGPRIALYTDKPRFLMENNDIISNLVNQIKKRIVIRADEKVPSDPLTWATSQITDKIPEFSWKGKYILSEKEMRKTYWKKYRYTENVVFRKKYKKDPEGLKKAEKQLDHDTGKNFWPNYEISIRQRRC